MDEKRKKIELLLSKIENLEIENDNKFKSFIKEGNISVGELMELWVTKDRLSKLKFESTKAIFIYDFLNKNKKPENKSISFDIDIDLG